MDKEQLTDTIEQCRKNDRAAQERLYRHFFPKAYSIAKKYVRDEHELISVINDGFLKAFKHISSYSFLQGNFEAWLVTIISRKALDHLKSVRKEETSVIPFDYELPDQSHMKVVKPEYLQGLIKTLPPITKSVLSLNIDGYTHKEISTILRISENSSRWHLSEARKRIKNSMDEKSTLTG